MIYSCDDLKNKITLGDCMDYMREMPDNYIDLAIVDSPYGLESSKRKRHGTSRIDKSEKILKWDCAPEKDYFDELFRISKNCIIWGGNNFNLPKTEYFIVWDKKQTVDNFASAEYAWTNCKKPAKVFRYSIHKEMSERKKNGGKIHPTQKPVKLYQWLLINYAKDCGNLILDTHSGSGSLACACHIEKYDFIAIEKDNDYHRDSVKRLDELRSQGVLF